MNVLIIYAHFERKSFNAAMLATAIEVLEENGHQVAVSDLYGEEFSPVPNAADFSDRADPDHFDLMREQAHANLTGRLPEDLVREQERVRWADTLIFQFPFWWWSVPAILKGWIDRVFANGFAYGSQSLVGKGAMLAMTAETRAARFATGAEYPILESLEGGVLRYCGLEVLPRFVAPEILSISDQARQELLSDFASHLRHHLSAEQSNTVPIRTMR